MQEQSNWNGFLPKGAIVMARRRPQETLDPLVLVEGNPQAELVFIGEATNENPSPHDRPFVGPAGDLLVKMIEAMGLKREHVYLCGVVKSPAPSASYSAVLHSQLETIGPKVIVALGTLAAQTLLDTDAPITQLRGSFKSFRGAQLMPTLHPSDLLRTPISKREAWADLQAVARALGIPLPAKKS